MRLSVIHCRTHVLTVFLLSHKTMSDSYPCEFNNKIYSIKPNYICVGKDVHKESFKLVKGMKVRKRVIFNYPNVIRLFRSEEVISNKYI